MKTPDLCKDISIQMSSATTKLSLVGAIGQPALQKFQPGYNLQAKQGQFVLFKNPSDNIKTLLTRSSHSTFSVESPEKCSPNAFMSNSDNFDPDKEQSAQKFLQMIPLQYQLNNSQQSNQLQAGPCNQEVKFKKHYNISFTSSMALISKVFATKILPVLLSLAIIRPDQLSVNFPSISPQEIQNFSNTWSTPGLLQVFVSKNTFQSETIKFILRGASVKNPGTYLDLTNEISTDDDPSSDQLMNMNLCKECRIRSSQCKTCRWLNSHKSLEELNELTLIRDSISILPQDQGRYYVQVHFPFCIDIPRLFSP